MNKTLLFQSHTHNFFGGGEYSLLAIMKESLEKGFYVHVIVPARGEFEAQAKNAGITVHIIKSYWWTCNNRNEHQPKTNKAAIEKTKKLIEKLKPNLCVTNTITTPWLAHAAKELGVNHSWILREYGDVDHGLKFWLPMEQIGKYIDHTSSKIFVNSNILKDHYQKLTGRNNIDIIYPAVEIPKPTTDKNPFRDAQIKLVCVGNLSEGKGQLDAVKAVQKLVRDGHDPQLLLVGLAADADYQKMLEDYINKLNLSKYIKLVGYQNNPANIVSFADINLVCSKNETFGRVTIESLLLGTPVIGTNSGNTPNLLGYDDKLLYEYGNSNELAKKILKYMNSKTAKLNIVKLQKSTQQKYSFSKAHTGFFKSINATRQTTKSSSVDDLHSLEEVIKKQKQRSKVFQKILDILSGVKRRVKFS